MVGILASVALPAHQSYTVKARATEGIAALGPARMAVSLYGQLNGVLPPGGDNVAAGFTQNINTTYVDTVDWHIDQRIEIEFNEAALGITGQLELGLEPQINNGRITGWLCGQDGGVPVENYRYLPDPALVDPAKELGPVAKSCEPKFIRYFINYLKAITLPASCWLAKYSS
jgi:type IV pilus assembly protein PilA